MTIRDNRAYIRVLLYSYYTTITGWDPPKEFRFLGVLRVFGFRGLAFPLLGGLGLCRVHWLLGYHSAQ